MKPRTETEAVAAGRQAGEDVKNRAEKRAEVGKGGQEMGKWRSFSHLETAFSHLFPCFSTQVVDFPHLAMVSIFWGGTQNSRMSGRGMIGRGMGRKPNGAWNQYGEPRSDGGTLSAGHHR